MGISECKRKTPSNEFVLWRVDIEERDNEHNAEHYYLAQIAKEICRTNAKHPNQIKTEHFLLTFGSKETEQKKPRKKLTLEEATIQSQQMWFSMFPPKEPIHGNRT